MIVDFSGCIHDLRCQLAMTQEEFAEQIGVSRQIVSNWERGCNHPTYKNWYSIRKKFGEKIDIKQWI
ncbi:helix-turn-helix transcriptional regulator [Facklamia hominis]|uniref:helix-turn-helix transcriptional regulator n=1 Tax=Facklamia hominis TaxID=178214 RepID=UPI000C7D8450|nr:helix-turn-helix transcriptional regulator [Facklamia hominis]PKY92816.1 hypothetical protein CYJ56_05920 [Facklamia hominis]